MSRVLPIFAFLSLATAVSAQERRFARSLEAETLGKGCFELQQWATLDMEKDGETYRDVTLREVFAYGFTDTITGIASFNSRFLTVSDTRGVEGGTEFDIGGSLEIRWQALDPDADFIGCLLSAEGTSLGHRAGGIGRLALSKTFGDFRVALNGVYEYMREEVDPPGGDDTTITEYVVDGSFGAAYAISSVFTIGVEAVNTHTFDGSFGETTSNVTFAGPTLHVAAGDFWATVSWMQQLGSEEDLDLVRHEKYFIRVIVGFSF